MKIKKGKSIVLVAALAVLTLAIGAGGAIFWWMHSPYFALQQIGTSISNRDAETFYRYCDANTLVTTLTNELFLQPAMSTHGMSQFQNYVAAGAIVMTKAKMDNALLTNIDRMVAPVPHTSFYHVFPEHLYWQGSQCQNVYSFHSRSGVGAGWKPTLSGATRQTGVPPFQWRHTREGDAWRRPYSGLTSSATSAADHVRSFNSLPFSETPSRYTSSLDRDSVQNLDPTPEEGRVKLVAQKLDLGDIARNLGHELKHEQDDLKRLAAQRMQEYAASHQDKLIGRLICGPAGGGAVKSLLAEYGFQTNNIKAMYVHNVDERPIATVEFFCPKVNANVPLSLEFTQITPGELFSEYRVIRVWKIKDTMQKLGEDTDTQVQELVVCSLQDIAPQKAQDRTGNLLKRLGQHENTKKLLEQLKGKF